MGSMVIKILFGIRRMPIAMMILVRMDTAQARSRPTAAGLAKRSGDIVPSFTKLPER